MKIRLYRTSGGGRGWSVPYQTQGMVLRVFAPIADGTVERKQRGSVTEITLKTCLEEAAKLQNVASELGRGL